MGHSDSSEPNSDRSTIAIVCAADNHYAMPLAVMACSVLANLPQHLHLLLFIIDGGIQAANRQKILRSLSAVGQNRCDVRWLPPPDHLLKQVQISEHITLASYYRLFIADLLPTDLEKVIYLDCDLILNTNIENLWNLDLGNDYLLAVQDYQLPTLEVGLLNCQQLQLPGNWKYFNAGVLLVNLRRWREANVTSQLLDYLQNNVESIRWHDQDVLNAVCADEWGELDPRWNQTPFIFTFPSWTESPFDADTFQQIISDPYVIHFASQYKPWNVFRYHPSHKKLFYRYVDRSAWAGYRYSLLTAVKKRIKRLAWLKQ